MTSRDRRRYSRQTWPDVLYVRGLLWCERLGCSAEIAKRAVRLWHEDIRLQRLRVWSQPAVIASPYQYVSRRLVADRPPFKNPKQRSKFVKSVEATPPTDFLCQDLDLTDPDLRHVVARVYQGSDFTREEDHVTLKNVIDTAVHEQRRRLGKKS